MNLPAGGSAARRRRPRPQYEAVRLFIARAVGVRPGLPGHERERAGRRGDRRPPPRHAARDRARRGPGQAPVARRRSSSGSSTSSASWPPDRATCRRASRRCAARSPGATTSSARASAGCCARLSVFIGGCELDSAEAVCGPPSELDGVDVLDCLTFLADQSLVRAEEVDGDVRASGCSTRSASSPPSS